MLTGCVNIFKDVSKLKQSKRGKAYTRYQRNRAINRKFNILRRNMGTELANEFYPKKRKGQLSKGKVHCSCPMCRRKSYDELSHRDKSKLIYDLQAINDYFNEDY